MSMVQSRQYTMWSHLTLQEIGVSQNLVNLYFLKE